jgi:hypothetical protein
MQRRPGADASTEDDEIVVEAAEIEMKVFGLQGPVSSQHGLDAAADRPADPARCRRITPAGAKS